LHFYTSTTNNICYGLEPSPKDEVEQHLTISANGRVWFTGYNYTSDFGKYEISRKCQFSIDKSITEELLTLFAKYCESEPMVCYATDIGIWEMEIMDVENKKYIFKGSLCGGVSVGDTDLTEYIREYIAIDNLFAFSGS
ncbi:hypothetical protein KM803_15615, partial [Clostridium tyrobutyricum]|uniref:hypothetical protein n=1 Tax=Clostridium tyrobutyricum TaxID=1519 RepID=UPI0034A0BAB6|nr:hypothetical protein [Clostridium tyrobutyricum]